MKNLLLVSLLAVSGTLVAGRAAADIPADANGVTTLPTITIYGRPNRPSVVIEVTRPTAAREAGAAHEGMRARLWATASSPPSFLPK